MAIRTNKKKQTAVFSGDMTIYTSAEHKQLLLEACPEGKAFTLDLTDVEEMDTSGLQLLLSLQKHMTGNNSELKLVGASEAVKSVLALTAIKYVKKQSELESVS